MSKRRVLLVTGNFHSVYRLPEVLAEGGCEVCLLTHRENSLRLCPFVSECFYSADSAPVSLINALPALIKDGEFSWVIFGDEAILAEAVRRFREPWFNAISPVPTLDSTWLGALVGKCAFALFAGQNHIPVPKSQVCHSLAAAMEAALEIGFPLMLKGDFGTMGSRVGKVETAAELEAVFNRVTFNGSVVVQQFVCGQVGITEMLLDYGHPVAFASYRFIETLGGPFGPSCVREP